MAAAAKLCSLILSCSLFLSMIPFIVALDNGLARTPPMGWMDWERFRCNIDCVHDPDNCISEKLFMEMADHMAKDGYKDVGYEYISIDDCYTNKKRDKNNNLELNTTRFPSGPHALADYIHGKGLKLGVYADYGVLTCAGYPGSYYYIEQDAKTFASWGADYLKMDGCYSDPKTMDKGYPEFQRALNATGRPILYCCEWPSYMEGRNMTINYTNIAENCNTWRNYDDVQDSWDSVLHILDYFAANQDTFIAAAGPGHWNDPDELVIGNFGLSDDQSRAQMALWAILAAPLIMSTDLRKIAERHKEILQNKEVIAVNQDIRGKMGRQWIKNKDNTEVWARPLSDGSVAVVLLNRRDDGMPHEIEAPFDKAQKAENGVEVEVPEEKSFASRLYELPVVMAAMEQLSYIYDNVKERNSVTKMACEAGETTYGTLSAAAVASKPIIQTAANTAMTLAKPVVGNVGDPVAALDHVACETLAKVEEKFPVITKTPTEIAEMTKTAVTSRANEYYENVQNMVVTKMVTSKASDVISFTELLAEIALPTDGSCKEDIEELETADKDSDKGMVVRASHLGKRVTRRGKRTLMTYKPVQVTVDAVSSATERLTGIADTTTETTKKVYQAYLYFPNTATKISGEVVISAKEFVFAFAEAHNVKDLPAAVLNLTKSTVQPITDAKDKALAYVFVPSQVIAEYVISSRPVQWIIPHIVSDEDMSKLEISMEEIEDEPESDS